MADDQEAPAPRRIETEVWRPAPDNPAYLRLVRHRAVREVLTEIREVVGDSPTGGDEYLCAQVDGDWPPGRIVVFAAQGANEGDYVHVEVLDDDRNRHTCVILGKTFAGRDAAWTFARTLADLLQA